MKHKTNYRRKTFYNTIATWWQNANRNEINHATKRILAKSTIFVVFVYMIGTLLSLYRTHILRYQ